MQFFDIRRLTQDLIDKYRGIFESKQQRLDFRPQRMRLPVQADAQRVSEILGNLLSNASKYTPSGGSVVVRVKREVRDRQAQGVVHVQDSGDGIDPSDHDYVFEEFGRLPAHRQQAGVGVGLAISREFARSLGGDLTLQSERRQGSTFSLRLPLASRR